MLPDGSVALLKYHFLVKSYKVADQLNYLQTTTAQ
jgi:hypothetical protein